MANDRLEYDRIQRESLDRRIQEEVRYAKEIQQQTGCTWGEALRVARNRISGPVYPND